MWGEWRWASLKEAWIALHLICALYAIKGDVYLRCDMTHSCMTRLIDAWHDSSMCDMTHWCVKDSFMRIPHMHRYGVNQKLAHHLIFLVCFILFSSKTCNCMPACNLSSFLSHTKFRQKICIRSSSFWFASIFHLFVCDFFGHRIWVQWIWTSLKERCIALHLICALYAI